MIRDIFNKKTKSKSRKNYEKLKSIETLLENYKLTTNITKKENNIILKVKKENREVNVIITKYKQKDFLEINYYKNKNQRRSDLINSNEKEDIIAKDIIEFLK